MAADTRCPHDGGWCHHQCNLDVECFREAGGMSFTEPVKNYPKCRVRIFNRGCSRPVCSGSRYCWQHDAIARSGTNTELQQLRDKLEAHGGALVEKDREIVRLKRLLDTHEYMIEMVRDRDPAIEDSQMWTDFVAEVIQRRKVAGVEYGWKQPEDYDFDHLTSDEEE